MAYNDFLDFEPTEKPGWQKHLPKENIAPSISHMITEIIGYKHSYTKLKQTGKLRKEVIKNTEFEFLLTFLFNTQVKDDTDLKNKEDTEEVVSEKDYPQIDNEKPEAKSIYSMREQKRKYSGHTSSSQETYLTDDIEECKRPNIGSFGPPYFPSLGDTVQKITTTYDIVSQTESLSKNLQETINLYKAYQHLAKQIDKIENKDRHLYLGLMDVDVCVLETHEILMDQIDGNQEKNTRADIKPELGKPGHFSTNKRFTNFGGKLHNYPQFASEKVARIAVQTLIDTYSVILEEIKNIPDSLEYEEEKTNKFFKCASLLLLGFLTLHPFGDGNGRLARLLCSYSLFTICPFLMPIYNVFSPTVKNDYLDAFFNAVQGVELPDIITSEIEAREATLAVLHQKPCDLCAMIIESNRYMWKEYLCKVILQSKN